MKARPTPTPLEESSRFKQPLPRRSFLGLAAVGTFAASWFAGILGALKLTVPAVYPEANPRFRVGRADLFQVGSAKRIGGRNVWIFRDEEGFFVISAICTHLGCIVDKKGEGFSCPCHGSVFDARGDVTSGPAPAPLPWLEIGLDPSGDLFVDTDVAVPQGTRFAV